LFTFFTLLLGKLRHKDFGRFAGVAIFLGQSIGTEIKPKSFN